MLGGVTSSDPGNNVVFGHAVLADDVLLVVRGNGDDHHIILGPFDKDVVVFSLVSNDVVLDDKSRVAIGVAGNDVSDDGVDERIHVRRRR